VDATIKTNLNTQFKTNKPRIVDKNSQFKELKAYMDQQYPAPATFIEFTNDPMLYYYVDREHPGFFNQNLLSLHSVKLQERYLEYLKAYDVPVVVFSNVTPAWGDAVDGISNKDRHKILHAYIKANYELDKVVDGKNIYTRKD
jgi:hypothetical protein